MARWLFFGYIRYNPPLNYFKSCLFAVMLKIAGQSASFHSDWHKIQNTTAYFNYLDWNLALFFKFFILTCLFKKISASLIWFVSKVYCTPESSHAPPPFLFHLNGRNFMLDNTHIEFGIIPLQSYDAMSPSLNVMNAKLLCVKLYLKKSRLFAFVSHCRISQNTHG